MVLQGWGTSFPLTACFSSASAALLWCGALLLREWTSLVVFSQAGVCPRSGQGKLASNQYSYSQLSLSCFRSKQAASLAESRLPTAFLFPAPTNKTDWFSWCWIPEQEHPKCDLNHSLPSEDLCPCYLLLSLLPRATGPNLITSSPFLPNCMWSFSLNWL